MKIKIFIVIFMLLSLCGCYDYKEINDLAIVSAIGLSKTDDNIYKVTAQVINTQSSGGESNLLSDIPTFYTYTSSDESLFKAIKNLTTIGSKNLYHNHFLLLLIDENVIKDDISDFFDVFVRETESRKEYNVFISKNNESEKILQTITTLQTLNAKSIIKSNELNSNNIGTTIQKKFEIILKEYLNKNSEVIIPSLILNTTNNSYDNTKILENSKENSTIINGPTAIFKDNKLNGYLTDNETMCLKILTNDIENIVYTHKDKNGLISLEIIDIKNNIQFNKNDNKVYIKVKMESILSEVTSNIDLKKLDTIQYYNNILSESLENDIKDFINNTKYKYESDLISIKDIIYKYENKYYKKIIDNYDEFYKNLDFDINVEFSIIQKGNATKEINNE
jgi:spore germination protein KC